MNQPLLTPADFVNLQKIVRRAKPDNFEECQVIVMLESKLGTVLQQLQRAQLAQKELEAKGENDVPAAD